MIWGEVFAGLDRAGFDLASMAVIRLICCLCRFIRRNSGRGMLNIALHVGWMRADRKPFLWLDAMLHFMQKNRVAI